VPIETGEGKASEKRTREVQFWALGFSRNRRKGYAVENLAGGLKTETVRYKLPVAGEVKTEIPVRISHEATLEGGAEDGSLGHPPSRRHCKWRGQGRM